MKKNRIGISIVIAVLLVLLLACSACSKPSETQVDTEPSSSQDLGPQIVPWDEPEETDDSTETEETEESNKNTAVNNVKPQETTGTTNQDVAAGKLKFEEYLKLSGEEQLAYANSFENMEAYVLWYNTEKEAYDNNQAIEITGPVDVGSLNGKNND